MKQGQTPSRDAQFWICAGFLLALALFLRLQGLGRSMWLDEYTSAYQLVSLTGIRNNLMTLRYDIHPPIYFLLLYLWERVGGAETEAWLRLLTVAISMAWMALALVWLKSYGRSAALIAGLILATQPFLVRYSQDIRNYALLILFTVVAFYFTSVSLRTPGDRRYAALAGLAVVFAIGTHMIAVLLPVSILIFALTATLAGPETAPASSTGPLRAVRKLVPLAASVIPIPAVVAFLLLRYFFVHARQSIPAWIPPGFDSASDAGRIQSSADREASRELAAHCPGLAVANHCPRACVWRLAPQLAVSRCCDRLLSATLALFAIGAAHARRSVSTSRVYSFHRLA
jgi:predicted membrane-bound mannosyltransferase